MEETGKGEKEKRGRKRGRKKEEGKIKSKRHISILWEFELNY